MSLPDICSFWHGPLGWLERLSIASFLEKGHRFTLYAYEEPHGLPPGAAWRDAAELVPADRLFFYKGSRTPAVFADLFRLELMAARAGIWADCDVICLKPFAGLGDYVMGIEAEGTWRNGFAPQVNNAVFACPADSDLLAALRAVFAPGAIPPGLSPWRALEVRVRRALGDPLPVHHMQFGATGPAPLNHAVRALGLMDRVSPRPVFYPMAYGAARLLLEPGSTIAAHVSPETLGLHVWRSALTDRGRAGLATPRPGSWFARECDRLGV